ncbi:MAG: PRC-barrel domain-containing protein [Thermodesulfobacteriota bacterium]
MNKTVLMAVLVSFLSLGLVVSNSYAARTAGGNGFMMLNSSDLIGASVKDSQGEFAGIVNEVMVDTEGHAFAVINHGDADLYGESGVNTPVPLQELRISRAEGRDTAVLKTDMEHLDLAPYLDPLKAGSRQYEADIYEYYGIQPSWSQGSIARKGGFQEFESLDLVGAAVEDSCGKVAGIVNEVMVDTEGHAFAVINHGDADLYGEEGASTPVPLQELQISQAKGQDIAVLKIDTEHLDSAPYLDLFQTNNPQYEANIFEFYGIAPYWTGSNASSK